MPLDGFTPYRKKDAEKYDTLRWWSGLTFGDLIDKAADIYPKKEAFVDGRSIRFNGLAAGRILWLATLLCPRLAGRLRQRIVKAQ